MANTSVAEHGALDGLFDVAADLSAGNLGRDADSDVTTVPLDVWQHTIDVTLTGYMYGIRHAMPIMIEQRSGSIINTMSSAVWKGEAARVAYQAAKSGLVGLTRHAATVGGKHGVRTNMLSPGVVLTAAALAATTEEFREKIRAAVRSPAPRGGGRHRGHGRLPALRRWLVRQRPVIPRRRRGQLHVKPERRGAMSDLHAGAPDALVRVEQRPDGVATVRLNQPPLNALSFAVLDELRSFTSFA